MSGALASLRPAKHFRAWSYVTPAILLPVPIQAKKNWPINFQAVLPQMLFFLFAEQASLVVARISFFWRRRVSRPLENYFFYKSFCAALESD